MRFLPYRRFPAYQYVHSIVMQPPPNLASSVLKTNPVNLQWAPWKVHALLLYVHVRPLSVYFAVLQDTDAWFSLLLHIQYYSCAFQTDSSAPGLTVRLQRFHWLPDSYCHLPNHQDQKLIRKGIKLSRRSKTQLWIHILYHKILGAGCLCNSMFPPNHEI